MQSADLHVEHAPCGGEASTEAQLKEAARNRVDSIEDARMNLLWGIVLGTIFLLIACVVAFHDGRRAPSLSETFEDPSTLEGKFFTVALIVPAIAYWISGYHWKLSNVRVFSRDYSSYDWWCRFLRILSNICFIIIAIVPHIDRVEWMEHPQARRLRLIVNFAYVHLLAGFLSFLCFAVSEIIVITKNLALTHNEVWWRSLSIATFTSSMVLYFLNEVVIWMSMPPKVYAGAWAFRFEVTIATGVIWSTQIIWYFGSPKQQSRPQGTLRHDLFYLLPYPHMSALVVIVLDLYRRGVGRPTVALGVFLLVLFFLTTLLTWTLVTSCRVKAPKPMASMVISAAYGTCMDVSAA